MHKSTLTNGLALAVLLIGSYLNNTIIQSIGLFALSGALTNWLAIHMLFEKVPGLYGSGVIPNRFEDFKAGIHALVMQQFFSQENIQRFMANNQSPTEINFSPIIQKLDLTPTFDSLVAVIQASSFGQMLGMFGGVEALEPMREPFVKKMREAFEEISQQAAFKDILQEQLQQPGLTDELQLKITHIVEQRLAELTPKMVKDIIQRMIKQHLGWLVVWGGVFGGLIGLTAGFYNL
ncbi:DUF445 domain-containing protein [Paraglaciecola aestuariivivens]